MGMVGGLGAFADRPTQRKGERRGAHAGGALTKSVPVYSVLDLNARLAECPLG